MRNLNNSLPGNSPQKQQIGEPPEQLLQDFKAAALAVTKLYKTAASDQAKARSDGYQVALDELLAFLDKENIGLSDGEGWRIRIWATERLDGRDQVSQQIESDDELVEKADRASSPITQRSQSTNQLTSTARMPSPPRMEPSEPRGVLSPTPDEPSAIIQPPTQDTFNFRSSLNYPQDTDVTLADLNLSDGSRAHNQDPPTSSHASAGVSVSRPSRTHARNNNHAPRLNARSTTTIGRGTGQKRKINPLEFFDFGRDGFSGGGKRGRFT